jgi:tetratricopeptide (TPR) repeat protein
MQALAAAYHDAGRRDAALKLREEALTLYRKTIPEYPGTIQAMERLAESYLESGRRDEAVQLQEEALALRRKVSVSEHPNTVLAMLHLAELCFETGRRDQAIKLREEAFTLSGKVFGPERPGAFEAMNEWAWTLATSSSPEIRNGTNAVSTAEQVVAAPHRRNAEFLDSLAAAYAETRQFEKAAAAQKEAIGLLQSEQEKKAYDSRLQLYQANKPCRVPVNP